jgi:hypothetical protein
VTSKRTLYVRKFLGVPNVTRREIHPCDITDTGSTPENGREGWSFDIGICSFLKASTWYNLMLRWLER